MKESGSILDVKSRDQLPPVAIGFDVTKKLLAEMPSGSKLKDLILQRRNVGIQRYGQSLYSKDGRVGLRDALDEMGDLAVYVEKVFGLQAEEAVTVPQLREFVQLWEELKRFVDERVRLQQ